MYNDLAGVASLRRVDGMVGTRGRIHRSTHLIVPLTLLKHHLGRYQVPDWVHQQVYLHPYPKELMLRNHV
jgi:hypothetical protein